MNVAVCVVIGLVVLYTYVSFHRYRPRHELWPRLTILTCTCDDRSRDRVMRNRWGNLGAPYTSIKVLPELPNTLRDNIEIYHQVKGSRYTQDQEDHLRRWLSLLIAASEVCNTPYVLVVNEYSLHSMDMGNKLLAELAKCELVAGWDVKNLDRFTFLMSQSGVTKLRHYIGRCEYTLPEEMIHAGLLSVLK